MTDSFEDVEPLQIEDKTATPVEARENPERDRKWLTGFLNLLAADDEPTRAAAALKIKGMADRKKMLVSDMILAVLGAPAVREAPPARTEAPSDEAEHYTAAGVPRHERRHKAADHNLTRLRDAYTEFGETCDLEPGDRAMIEDVLQLKLYDWELSDRLRKFVRDITKKLLATGEEPLA